MRRARLVPVRKEHPVGVPLLFNVSDEFDNTAPVVAWLLYRPTTGAPASRSNDMAPQGADWSTVRAFLTGTGVTPSVAGLYTLMVAGAVGNGAQRRPATFRSVTIKVS
jgi:hypothetical protein